MPTSSNNKGARAKNEQILQGGQEQAVTFPSDDEVTWTTDLSGPSDEEVEWSTDVAGPEDQEVNWQAKRQEADDGEVQWVETEPEDPDSWPTVIGKTAENIAYGLSSDVGGLMQYAGENALREQELLLNAAKELQEDPQPREKKREGPGGALGINLRDQPVTPEAMDKQFRKGVDTFEDFYSGGRIKKALAQNKLSDEAEEAFRNEDYKRLEELIKSGEGFSPSWLQEQVGGELQELGKETFEFWTEQSRENQPDVEKRSPKWYISKGGQFAGRTLLPAALTTIATKDPRLGMSVMFPQVLGQSYARSREEGMSPVNAQKKAVFDAITETGSEAIPLGILTRTGGKMLMKPVKTMSAEGIQESVNEAFQMGYDAGILDESMEPDEAMQRLIDAGIFGMVGGGMVSAPAMVSEATGRKQIQQRGKQLKEKRLAEEEQVNQVLRDLKAGKLDNEGAQERLEQLFDAGMKNKVRETADKLRKAGIFSQEQTNEIISGVDEGTLDLNEAMRRTREGYREFETQKQQSEQARLAKEALENPETFENLRQQLSEQRGEEINPDDFESMLIEWASMPEVTLEGQQIVRPEERGGEQAGIQDLEGGVMDRPGQETQQAPVAPRTFERQPGLQTRIRQEEAMREPKQQQLQMDMLKALDRLEKRRKPSGLSPEEWRGELERRVEERRANDALLKDVLPWVSARRTEEELNYRQAKEEERQQEEAIKRPGTKVRDRRAVVPEEGEIGLSVTLEDQTAEVPDEQAVTWEEEVQPAAEQEEAPEVNFKKDGTPYTEKGVQIAVRNKQKQGIPAEAVEVEPGRWGWRRQPLETRVEEAAQEADTEPTESQKEAGNYRKGRVSIQGLDVSIENPKGSTRSGTAPDGTEWSTTMQHHYGYVRGSEGKDGDQVDVFVGPEPESEQVFVVDQVDPETGKFDEHKAILGAQSEQEARDIYLSNYEEGWQGLGDITEMQVDEFKDWLNRGKRTRPAGKPQEVSKNARGLRKDEGQVLRTEEGTVEEAEPEPTTDQLEEEGALRQRAEQGGKDLEREPSGQSRDRGRRLEEPTFEQLIQDARQWQGAIRNAERMVEGDNKAKYQIAKHNKKSTLERYLMGKHGIERDLARDVTNTITNQNIEPDESVSVADFQGEPWADQALAQQQEPQYGERERAGDRGRQDLSEDQSLAESFTREKREAIERIVSAAEDPAKDIFETQGLVQQELETAGFTEDEAQAVDNALDNQLDAVGDTGNIDRAQFAADVQANLPEQDEADQTRQERREQEKLVQEQELEIYKKGVGRIREMGGLEEADVREQHGEEGVKELRRRFGPAIVTKDGVGMDVAAQWLADESPSLDIESGDKNSLWHFLTEQAKSKREITGEAPRPKRKKKSAEERFRAKESEEKQGEQPQETTQEQQPTEGEPPEEKGAKEAESGRAQAGGEIGVNGYFYKGGQFLPSSSETEPGKFRVEIDGKKKILTTKKEPIAPNTWEVQPTPLSRSIFSIIQGLTKEGQNTGERQILENVTAGDGTPVTPDMEMRPGVKGILTEEPYTLQELVNLYNRGARWIDVKPAAAVGQTQQQEQKTKTSKPTIRKSDISHDLALRAHYGTSHTPEDRADLRQREYVDHMEKVYDDLSKLAKTEEQEETLNQEFRRYQRNYISKLNAYLEAHSRVMSPMITGPAKFPSRSNQKKADTADKRLQELLDFDKKAQKAMRRKVKQAAPAEQQENEALQKLKRQITAELNFIRQIEQGERPGADKANFKNSLHGYIQRASKNHDADFMQNVLDYLRQEQQRLNVTAFTNRHKIWNLAEQAQPKAEEQVPEGPSTVAEFDGATVENVPNEERVRIHFDEKPGEEIRNALKTNGWKWSRANTAWQRKSTEAARQDAVRILDKYFDRATTEEGGPTYSFAGRTAETADTHSLYRAMRMIAQGEDAESVRQETGWFQGPDGKWRYEISDLEARVNVDAFERDIDTESTARKYKSNYVAKLGDLLDHPRLYAAYPWLKDVDVTTSTLKASSAEEAKNLITLDIHKHSNVQDYIEGKHRKFLEDQLRKFRERDAQRQGRLEWEIHPQDYNSLDEAIELEREFQENQIKMIRSELQKEDPGNTKAVAENHLASVLLHEVQHFIQGREEFARGGSFERQDYRQLGGEVEARNVQARRTMGESSRRTVPPEMTADVKPEDVVVEFRGEAAGAAPVPENALANRPSEFERAVEEHLPPVYQRAYHGTPYRGIDRFSTQKIGSGEGAQAFGWGLYFAGKKEIGEFYREKLSGNIFHWKLDGAEVRRPEVFLAVTSEVEDFIENEQLSLEVSHRDRDATPGEIVSTVIEWKQRGGGRIEHYKNALENEELNLPSDLQKIYRKAIERIESRVEVEREEGQLYEVSIPEESELLDWDKPLSEQGEKGERVWQAILAEDFDKSREEGYRDLDEAYRWENMTLDEYKQWLVNEGYGSNRGWYMQDGAVYKQNGNRIPEKNIEAQFRDHRNQMVFRDFAHLYNDLAHRARGQFAVSDFLNSLGIKGHKYKDASARGTGEESYNYVIYDDQAIEILDTYYSMAKPTVGIQANNLRQSIDALKKRWPNAPQISVVQSESELPGAIQRDIASKDAQGEIEGVLWRDQVYLVANNVSSVERAQFVTLHETIGHYGLRGVMGQEARPILKQAYMNKDVRDRAQALSKDYGFDLRTESGRVQATEEALANMAAEGVESSALDRVVAKVREWIRKVFPKLQMSDAEIRSLIGKGRAFVGAGGGDNTVAPEGEQAAYSRRQRPNISPEEFMRAYREVKAKDRYNTRGKQEAERVTDEKYPSDQEVQDAANWAGMDDGDFFNTISTEGVKGVPKKFRFIPHSDFGRVAAMGVPYFQARIEHTKAQKRRKQLAEGKNVPQPDEGFSHIFRTFEQRQEHRNALFTDLAEPAEDFWAAKGETLDELRDLIWLLDNTGNQNKQLKTIRKFQPLKDEKGRKRYMNGKLLIQIDPNFYDNLDTWMKNQGVSKEVRRAYLSARRALDKSLLTYYNWMLERGDWATSSDLQEYRWRINTDLKFYFPHKRRGNWYVQAKDSEGNVIFRQHFDIKSPGEGKITQQMAERKAQRIVSQLESKYPGATWTSGKVAKHPEEVFEDPIPLTAMQQILDSAANKIEANKEDKRKLRESLTEATSDILKGRGWGAHAIRRRNPPVEGYEMDDIQGVLLEYLSGLAGSLTKMDASHEATKALNEIVSEKQPKKYAHAATYVKAQLRNQDNIDRWAGNVKSWAFVRYLGLNFHTATLNITQNVIAGVPRLSQDVGASAFRFYKDALEYVAKGGRKGLEGGRFEDEETNLLNELYHEGISADNYTQEVAGRVQRTGPKTFWTKFVNLNAWPMKVAETFNRSSLALAAFRAARGGKVVNKATLEEFGYSRGEQWNYEDAKLFAERVTKDAHFVYGKENRPNFFTSTALGRGISPVYTFRTFSHNYLNLLRLMLFHGGGRGAMAFGQSMIMTAVMGGLTSLPLYNTLTALYQSLFDDDEDPARNAWRKAVPELAGDYPDLLRDIVTYGTPSMFGVNIGGSIRIETPGSFGAWKSETLKDTGLRALKDLIGIPWDMTVELPSKAWEAWQLGQKQRAIEHLPIIPAAVAHTLEATREYREGKTTVSGQPINTIGKKQPKQISAKDLILTSVGYNTLTSTKEWDQARMMNISRSIKMEKQRELATKLARAVRDENEEKLKDLVQEWQSWNKSAMQDKEIWRVITTKQLKASLNARSEARQPPKYMIQRFMELRDLYNQ